VKWLLKRISKKQKRWAIVAKEVRFSHKPTLLSISGFWYHPIFKVVPSDVRLERRLEKVVPPRYPAADFERHAGSTNALSSTAGAAGVQSVAASQAHPTRLT